MKLTDKDLETIVKRCKLGVPTVFISQQLKISQRRVQQIWKSYCQNKKIPKLSGSGRRPYAQHPKGLDDLICRLYRKHKMSASRIAKFLRDKKKLRVSHDKIHGVLLEHKMARNQPSKQKRRKPWVRYERDHSLSAGHMDWTEYNGKQCCVILDDSSRKILAGIECDNATAEQSIKLVQKVLDEYGHIRRIREIITDHGTQFWASRRAPKGQTQHSFEMFLQEQNVKHILCRIKHPQSNGKVERWFQEYKKHRKSFKTFNEFVDWYNRRPHGSLDLDTPEQTFWQRLQPFVLGRFLEWNEKTTTKMK